MKAVLASAVRWSVDSRVVVVVVWSVGVVWDAVVVVGGGGGEVDIMKLG